MHHWMHLCARRTLCTTFAACLALLLLPLAASAAPCIVTGPVVTLPPAGCGYLSPSDVHMIIDGLPKGEYREYLSVVATEGRTGR